MTLNRMVTSASSKHAVANGRYGCPGKSAAKKSRTPIAVEPVIARQASRAREYAFYKPLSLGRIRAVYIPFWSG
mgnify:CR=1 FL=1